jgi:hypothetical protein
MPTVKDGNLQRQRYAWFIKHLMEEKESEARKRLQELTERQEILEPINKKFLVLYKLHIAPLMEDVKEFTDNEFEMRKIEHFLQRQDERAEEVNHKVQYLPSAPKGQVGKRLTKDERHELIQRGNNEANVAKLKSMDQDLLAKLLEQIK